MRCVFASLVFVVFAVGCPAGVDVPDPADAGPQVPGGEGEGEGEGEGDVGGEGEGEGIVIIGGEGEGEGGVGGGEGEGEGEGDPPLPPGLNERSIDVGGEQRTLELIVPDAINDGVPLPLVIALHGNGDDGFNFQGFLGLADVAGASDAVFAVLDGRSQDITAGGTTFEDVFWDAYTDTATNDDIAFIDGVIAALVESGGVDERRVHVFGYSQGGFMAFRYGLERSNVVASAVVVSAGDPFNDNHLVDAAARRLPFKLRCGSEDPLLGLAQAANQKLSNGGHETSLTTVAGANHVPFPIAAGETTTGAVQALITFQLARQLP